MQFLEKSWKMLENTDIQLVTIEKRRSYLVQTKLSHYKIFHRKFAAYRNLKNSNIHA